LLDELGSGTDPVEGGALGCAIIDQLSKRDVTTFLTTHLSIIKVFVHENRAMVNASVRFNRETLEPEYILDVGLPGASHALSIAKRLNLSPEVLDKAKSMLSDETIQLENVLERLDSSQRSLAKNMEQAKVDSEKAAAERERLQNELKELKKKRRSMLHEAQKEAESLVENARREMEKILKSVRQKGEDAEEIKKTKEKVLKKRDNLRHSIKQTEAKPAEPVKAESLNAGDRVWIEKLQDHGTVVSISADKKKVQIDLNGMPFSMKVSELGKANSPAPKKEIKKSSKVNLNFKRSSVSMELNVIGKRVEDALNEVEKYLDNAMSSGLETVRIVHGRGTGALRQALHNYLKDASFVSKFSCPEPDDENSPGDSVTDVWL
ncbi:MAG: Smr/MutS family protein, partial [Lentisphaeraceae bacterium]|nr:Smr/MutS family protein [Lentisphaeraceae bacterium]